LKILMVCAEFAPLAKTGGLADAVAGLSGALAQSGHDVRVLLPNYGQIAKAHPVVDSFMHRASGCRFVEIRDDTGPVRVYLLDAPELFGDDAVYADDDRDAARFIALADAAVDIGEALNWTADVVHCHDWHTALVPVLLRERRATHAAARRRTVLTLHNIGYQGVFNAAVIDTLRRPALGACIDRSGPEPVVNFLRSGVQTADLLTTVSPTYAREIQTAAYGMGLEDLLRARRENLIGILNGVDYSIWDPSVDPFIGTHYDRTDPQPKREVKRSLCADLGLAHDSRRPLIGVVTRLVSQKGIDLLAAALPGLLPEDPRASFAVLGSGDATLEQALAGFAERQPARFSFTRGYDEALAHRILAGSDIVLVPSRYEPCGLTQLYALRYGSIPVVRSTGGLADTVQHFDPASGMGNGSVFEHADPQGLSWGIGQALDWFDDDSIWQRLIDNAMAADFSWRRQVGKYVEAYRQVVAGAASLVGAASGREGKIME
jgi:starch synthase